MVFDLEGGDGYAFGTLQSWSSRVGPVYYTQWQQVFYALRREGSLEREGPEDESRSALATRMKAWYNEIHQEIYGPSDQWQPVSMEKASEKLWKARASKLLGKGISPETTARLRLEAIDAQPAADQEAQQEESGIDAIGALHRLQIARHGSKASRTNESPRVD